jgi:hypothetical protein
MGTTGPYIKKKIGSHLTYPVKFTEVCEALSPAVEQLDVEMWFWGWYPPRKNEARETYQIVEVRYSPQDERSWRLEAAPIPRALRTVIRPLLIPALSERIRPWPLIPRPLGWHSRYHSLRGYFSGTFQKLEFQEHDAVG